MQLRSPACLVLRSAFDAMTKPAHVMASVSDHDPISGMRPPLSALLTLLLLALTCQDIAAQRPPAERRLHYRPHGKDFVLEQGRRRFNRALYGSNTAFRVEAGDLPEFSMYLPGMGGNLRLGLRSPDRALWLNDADSIETRYSEGAMKYRIRDRVLGAGTLSLELRALTAGEGLILKIAAVNTPADVGLLTVYGGLSGKKFSRNGDIGADPESGFELQPDYCIGNAVAIDGSRFTVTHLNARTGRHDLRVDGIFPEQMTLFRTSVATLDPASLAASAAGDRPVLAGRMKLGSTPVYFLLRPVHPDSTLAPVNPELLFGATRAASLELWNRVSVNTPDRFINTLGGALGIAADGIWEAPSYLHGAVAWRMRLNAWRGAYVADPLGWHERAREHFRSYARSQLTAPEQGPVVPDTALHAARQQEKLGTAVFSSGYIPRNPGGDQRPHHYDMNLVFIDQLLNHFDWTGDTAFVREMWPLLRRHLAWEKRNFDMDGDGLYDAYAAIWASDALQYSGGGVMHTSAYNLRANRAAAALAVIIGEDPEPYAVEAAKIKSAIESKLWLPSGWYAEYRDLLGEQLVHPQAAAWTVYHAIDSKVPDATQAAQILQYADRELPRIPFRIRRFEKDSFFLTATSNWQPYTWSINNVALAENLHLALAYWQGGRSQTAFRLWKSALVESMYLSASPGGFEQLSAYDAHRGELYRDFADPVGMAARSLVEGLFGFRPDAMHDSLVIRPGFPEDWYYAGLHTPGHDFEFRRTAGNTDHYRIGRKTGRSNALRLEVPMAFTVLKAVRINGRSVSFRMIDPLLRIVAIECGKGRDLDVELQWQGDPADREAVVRRLASGVSGIPTDAAPVMRWVVPGAGAKQEQLGLAPFFNDSVTAVFRHRYLSPRPTAPTLQLPWQGIGNWCYPLTMASIRDSALRAAKSLRYDGIAFNTDAAPNGYNIAFTSKWNNFPDSITIPLRGAARHLYLLMTGTTNPMQSQLENGRIIIRYTDGTTESLSLRNPETWWPIEQDYYEDGLAFHLKRPPPPRLELNTGRFYRMDADPPKYSSIKGFSNRAVDGGAATVLNLPLNPAKTLRSLQLKATANDVIIGLISATLIR